MQLPSNKVAGLFIAIVLILVLIIGGDTFFKKTKTDGQPEQIDADLILKRNTTENSSVDSDNDGLSDWKEVLYGSDINNSDSDNDGTSDGEEVELERDPTVPGPDDKLVNTQTFIETNFDVPGYTPGSLTDNISKNLFSNYLAVKNTGAVDSASSESIANALVNEINQNTQIEIKYIQSDLNVISSSDFDITKYANEVAISWIDYNRQLDSISNLSEEEYLNQSSVLYKSAADFLSKINVPDVAVNIHLELVNNIYSYAVVIEELSLYEKDPIKSLIAAKQVQTIHDDQLTLFTALANYFKDNGIIFEDNEISRFWNLYE